MLTIDLEPLFAAELEYERAAARLGDLPRRAVDAATREGHLEAINTRRYKDQTGRLTGSIKGFVEISTWGAATGWVVARQPYASFVDAGTRPHEIHGNPFLTFKARDGSWVTTRMVHHPGTKPDGFMGRAFHKIERVLLREVEVGIAEMQRFLDG